MDFQQILSKQTSDGRAVVVFGGEYLGEAIIRRVTIGAETIRGISSNVYSMPKPQGAATHYIAGKPPVGLTSAEADQIIAALATLQAIINTAKAPVAAVSNLSNERRDLVAQHAGLCDEQSYQFERAHAQQNENAWNIKASYEPKIEAAEAAIAAFDAAHPEILAEIKTEEADSVERNRWM